MVIKSHSYHQFVGDNMQIISGDIDSNKILSSWNEEIRDKNLGAFISFVGIVRDEDNITGLSFDIYKPLLIKWFSSWEKIANNNFAKLFFAHSIGDVKIHSCSFVCAIASKKRRFGLEFIDKFVEDFKNNAPIWKYDLKDNKRIYALNRSHRLNGAGILKDI